jgi:hypothetical protein
MTYPSNQYIFDNRSEHKAANDYRIGKENELLAINGLVDFYASKDIACSFQSINPYESWLDGEVHTTPDFYFFKGKEIHTLEVKFSTTGNFLNDTIFVKPAPFFTCKDNPSRFPNFKTLVATDDKFTIIDAKEFTNDKLQQALEWSSGQMVKKAIKFPIERKWYEWINKLE